MSGFVKEKEKRRGERIERESRYGQPRRLENRAPKGPNALRAYAPARTRTAETLPRTSWAFFCAADDDADVEEEVDDDEEVEEVENGRRRCGACVRSKPRRNVVTIMSFFFFGEGESTVGREVVVVHCVLSPPSRTQHLEL